MFAMKFLALLWVLAFLYKAVTVFFENDQKFGRYNGKTALLCGLFYSTWLPISTISSIVVKAIAHCGRLLRFRKARKP